MPHPDNPAHGRLPVVALDLEGTLISNAISQLPRPGLMEFLTGANEICDRLVIFTSVSEPTFRTIARLLAREDVAPPWFANLEYITWQGPFKDLRFIPGADPGCCWLIDDHVDYIHPDQKGRWLEIPLYATPYSDADTALKDMLQRLRSLAGTNHASGTGA